MRRKIFLFLLCVLLLIGAIVNSMVIADPPTRMTTYFRTHRHDDLFPEYETDVPATIIRLIGLDISLVCIGLVFYIAGGFIFRKIPNTVRSEADDVMWSQ